MAQNEDTKNLNDIPQGAGSGLDADTLRRRRPEDFAKKNGDINCDFAADDLTVNSINGTGVPAVLPHTIGGASHTADTLANLNSKVSDATLIDTADTRIPSQTENNALIGTDGSPSGSNPYVTDSDSRMTDDRVPTGSAGGDLGGTYPNPDVEAIRGNDIENVVPADQEVLTYVSANSRWEPQTVSAAGGFESKLATMGDTKSTTCTSIGSFVYRGTTTTAAITAIDAIAYVQDAGSPGQIRVQDVTNASTIAESGSFTNTTSDIISLGTVNNLPTGQAIFEVQIHRISGPSRSIFIENTNIST